MINEGGAGVESCKGGTGDGDAEFFLDEVDGLVVGVFVVPGDDLFALFEGEMVEDGSKGGGDFYRWERRGRRGGWT